MADPSSSSDFSSDEEDTAVAMEVSPDPSLALRTVEIEALEEPVEDEISSIDLLTSLRADGIEDALLQALEPVLTTWTCGYDAYTTALYYLSSLWPEDATAATQRTLTRLRIELYRRFHCAFPLTPELYREYIAAVDASPHKLRLYAQAACDYWSVTLTIDHLQLLAECEDDLPRVTRPTLQQAMATALATVGHHYTQGHDVWATVRDLTTQHFEALDGDHDAEKEGALRDLFVQQMQRPLQQNDLVMSEFRAWNAYNTLAPAAERERLFQKAEAFHQRVLGPAVYKKLNQLEARLAAALAGTPFKDATEPEAPEVVWTQYLHYTQSKLLPLLASPAADGYIVCLFERAIASVCLSSSLWRQYVDYVTTHHTRERLKHVLQRATRNVSFDAAFWIERLLAMETSGDAVEHITKMILTELLARTTPPLMDSAHMAQTLTNYCGVVRRLTDNANDAVDAAVATCKRFFETAFKDDATPVAAVLTFQAQCLAFRICAGGDVTLRQQWLGLWQSILRIRGAEAAAWVTFYDEYRFTHAASPTLIQELRDAVFTQAMNAVQDYPLLIHERWLAFELAVGDRGAYTRVRQQYQRLVQGFQYPSPAQNAAPAVTAAPSQLPRGNEKPLHKKRKTAEHSSSTEPVKRLKSHTTTEPSASKADAKKTERFTNDHTVFVCNVSKDATQDDLHAVFAAIPSLRDVRLVVKERGSHVKSRGMAYVQFHDDSGVTAALTLNGTLVHDQPLKIDRSIPPSAGKAASKTKANSNDAKGGKATTTVYVGGLLPPEREPITEDQVKQALTEVLGDNAVKQVLILTDRRGRPKDYGLVEVTDAKLVNVAVEKQHDLKRKLGDQVTVQTSRMTIDQVVRHRDEQKQATQQAKEARQPAAKPTGKMERLAKPSGGFQVKTAPHAKPHTRVTAPIKPVASSVSLMPRALRKKTVVTETKSEATTPTAAAADATPKTNADFRKLFLS